MRLRGGCVNVSVATPPSVSRDHPATWRS
jgi:hypothetical protein